MMLAGTDECEFRCWGTCEMAERDRPGSGLHHAGSDPGRKAKAGEVE